MSNPWDSDKCFMRARHGGLLLLAILMKPNREDPCDRCNESRAKCGGNPRKDGDPRP